MCSPLFEDESTFIPEVEQRVEVTVAALFLAWAVLRVERWQLQRAVVVSDCYPVVDFLLVES